MRYFRFHLPTPTLSWYNFVRICLCYTKYVLKTQNIPFWNLIGYWENILGDGGLRDRWILECLRLCIYFPPTSMKSFDLVIILIKYLARTSTIVINSGKQYSEFEQMRCLSN